MKTPKFKPQNRTKPRGLQREKSIVQRCPSSTGPHLRLLLCIAPLVFCFCALAQYSLDWSTIDGGGGTSTGGNNTGGTNTGGNNTGGANTGGNNTGGNNTGGAGGGLADVGSLVVLGDSISDGGGVAPYYYDLLKADLQAKYGAVEYHHQAQSGSKTDALLTQIGGLPATLTPPVAVVITSGGNDMKAAILQILAGLDESKRTTMGDNLQAALDLLLTPNQFGSGVDVHVFEGNIYDASDGSGKYGMYGCKAPLNLFPAQPTDTYFTNWNAVITDKVSAHGQTLIDMHAEFYGHGFQSDPNWYADDCIHPSQIGHDQLRHLFYKAITGDALP